MKHGKCSTEVLLLSLMTVGTELVAQQKQKAATRSSCVEATIKKIVLEALNGSPKFQQRGVKVSDFQGPKLLGAALNLRAF